MADDEHHEGSEGEEHELEEEPQSILKSLISQLKVGMDLSRVTLPTFVLEPRSLLEKLTDFMSHTDEFTKIPSIEDPEERFLQVVRFYVSGWHVRPKGVKKPYNPIIGETFRCSWELVEKDSTQYLAEQVSHHPPISAFAYCNRSKQLFIHGYIHPKSKFLGNSAASIMDGRAEMLLLNRNNEKYLFTFPDTYARGILMGKLLMETVGHVKIECPDTGYIAEIEFKAKGYFRGEYNALQGKIKKDGKTVVATLAGKWDSEVTITHKSTGETSTFFKVKGAKVVAKTVKPIDEQYDYESIRLWDKVTKAIKANDLEAATDAKHFLEQRQRDEAKERQEKGEEWKTTHFSPDENGGWKYNKVPSGPFSEQDIAENALL